MKEIGLFVFPWDLQDEGIDHVMAFAASSGITTLYMASVYHAGFLLQPHNPVHRVYRLEDGVTYFHPREELYGAIKPMIAQVSRETDWFEVATNRASDFGLKISAWTVCMHNTRLGLEYPDATVRDAFLNPRTFALCPSHPDVRRYIRAVVKDLSRYPLKSVLLEAFRYMDVIHGEHHERWSIPLPSLERSLMTMSFAPSDLSAAAQAGVDGNRLRLLVKAHLKRFYSTYPDLASDLPRTEEEFSARVTGWAAYKRCLVSVMDSLLDEIVNDLCGKNIELIGQGQQEFNVTVSPSHKGFPALLCSLYNASAADAPAIVREAKRSALPGQEVYAGIRVGFGAIASPAQLSALIQGIQAEADGVLLYNYAECAETILKWIGPALREKSVNASTRCWRRQGSIPPSGGNLH